MAVAFIPLLSEFGNFCEFSVPLEEMDTTFLLKRPSASAKGSDILAPFSSKVWILILLALILVGPTIYITIYLRYFLVLGIFLLVDIYIVHSHEYDIQTGPNSLQKSNLKNLLFWLACGLFTELY